MNDWEDRVVDASLQELHGSKPPDLSARVLLALQEQKGGPLPTLREPPPARRRTVRLVEALLAAAAVVAAAWFLGGYMAESPAGSQQTEVATVELEVRVVEGTLECADIRPGRATVRHAAPALATFAAHPGNRLRCEARCLAQVGPFGSFAAEPHTELEVKSMEFSRKQGVLVASTLTLGVITGAVTWHAFTRTDVAVAGDVLRLEAAPGGASGAAMLAENERLRQRVLELERQNEVLQTQASRTGVAAAPPVETPKEPPAEPEAKTPNAMAFTDPKFDAALSGIDWKLVGDVTNEMGPMLVQLAALAGEMKNGELSKEGMALAIKVTELNGKLVAQVPAMLQAGLPGYEANGAYTHPLVTANTLSSTLAAAGQPLTDAQRATMSGLVRTFSIENQSISDASREFDLEYLLAETEMKDRFYREMSTLLTPEQYRAMYPEGSQSNDGVSLFGTGIVTRPYTEVVPAANAADFARIASNKISESIGLDEATATKVRGVIERMTGASPELWQDPADSAETRLKFLKRGRTPAALRRQIEVMREIERSVSLTPEQKKQLRSMKKILVPLPKR
ncbi:MAG TPA: hypothetical protein VFD82_04310 [Planctomycetota bacterium]|nr:hypothetical protein [Planctomycetota bacterium]